MTDDSIHQDQAAYRFVLSYLVSKIYVDGVGFDVRNRCIFGRISFDSMKLSFSLHPKHTAEERSALSIGM